MSRINCIQTVCNKEIFDKEETIFIAKMINGLSSELMQRPAGKHSNAALAAILPTLQTHLPTSDAILNRTDFVARQEPWETRERKIADRRAQEQAELIEHNRRCAAMWKQKPVCPFCEGREIRYTNGKNVRKSFFQCVTCGRTFRPEDFPSTD